MFHKMKWSCQYELNTSQFSSLIQIYVLEKCYIQYELESIFQVLYKSKFLKMKVVCIVYFSSLIQHQSEYKFAYSIKQPNQIRGLSRHVKLKSLSNLNIRILISFILHLGKFIFKFMSHSSLHYWCQSKSISCLVQVSITQVCLLPTTMFTPAAGPNKPTCAELASRDQR